MEKQQKQQTKHHRGRRKKNRKKNILSNIIMVIAIAVFIYAAYNLWQIFSEYEKGTSEYEAIYDLAIIEKVPSIDEKTEEEQADKIFIVDFDKLKAINEDVVAWIRFEEPSQISYPVVLGIDNAKYLKTTFEGNTNSAGTLFIDMTNSGDFSDRNTFIYGHNMKNGSMFGRLREYKSSSFCKEHPYFYLYTPDGMESTYQVFSVAVVKDTSESYIKKYADDAAFEEYLDYIQSIDLYNTGVEVNKDSKIISLSTCTNVDDDERLLVHAVKVSEKVVEE